MPTPRDDERATTAATGAAGPQRVRASSTSAYRVGVGAATESVVATAEIPVVRAPQSRPGDPLAWSRYGPYEKGRHQAAPLPAPAAVRLVVWLLVFVFVLMLIGLAVEIAHPDWLAFLRNTSNASNAVAVRSLPPRYAYEAAVLIGRMYMVPLGPSAITVPSSRHGEAVVIEGGPASTPSTVQDSTASRPRSVVVRRRAAVEVTAPAVITIEPAGHREIVLDGLARASRPASIHA